MSEEIVVRQAAPTLAGIKTGSLFSCPCDSPEELRQEVRRINRLLAGKGLCLLPLRFDGGRALLYLYRPSRLRQDLEDAEAVRLLARLEKEYPRGDMRPQATAMRQQLAPAAADGRLADASAGKGKAEEAAKMAISSPLLETSINGAHGVLINVTGSMDIGLEEVEQAASLVQDAVHPDAVTIFGGTFDASLEAEIRVTVIATGFAENKPQAEQPAQPAQPVQSAQPVLPPQTAPQRPVMSQQAQQLNDAVDREASTARENIDRAYDDIFKIFSKDK